MFGHENVMVELTCQHDPGDDERNDMLARLAALADLGVVATGNVHFAAPVQARLGQALAAIRDRRSLAEMDGWLPAAGTAYLRSGEEMAERLRRYPGVLERTVELGRQCAFDFRGDRPPAARLPGPAGAYRGLLAARAGRPQGSRPVRGSQGPNGCLARNAQIARELEVIERLEFPGYFLIVHDIVEFLRRQRHLVPGPRVGGELGGLLRAGHHQR